MKVKPKAETIFFKKGESVEVRERRRDADRYVSVKDKGKMLWKSDCEKVNEKRNERAVF